MIPGMVTYRISSIKYLGIYLFQRLIYPAFSRGQHLLEGWRLMTIQLLLLAHALVFFDAHLHRWLAGTRRQV